MSQLENIISVRDICADEQVASLSGLDLMDAPEISAKNLANIANEEYVTGLNLAKKKVKQAITLVRNDMMSSMAANKAIPNLSASKYTIGEFKTSINYPAEAKERGVTLYKNRKIKGKLRKLKVHNVQVYALNDVAEATLKIYDDYTGGVVSTYNVSLEANKVNTFNLEYEVLGSFARVLLDGVNVSVAGTYLTCFTGCNGTMPNDCGFVKGWYDDKEISSKEGFGVNLEFSCECDYEQLLCDLAQTYVGEIVWLKSRVLLMEEHLRTNRLNNWVVYGRDETKDYLTDVENQYREKWQVFGSALPHILKQYNDDCLTCNGIKWATNV